MRWYIPRLKISTEDVIEAVGDQAGDPVTLGVQHSIRIRLLVETEDFLP